MNAPTLSELRQAYARAGGGWRDDPAAADMAADIDADLHDTVSALWDFAYHELAHRYAQWHELPRHLVDEVAALPPLGARHD